MLGKAPPARVSSETRKGWSPITRDSDGVPWLVPAGPSSQGSGAHDSKCREADYLNY